MNEKNLLLGWLRTLETVQYGPVDGDAKENLIKLIEDTRNYVDLANDETYEELKHHFDTTKGLWATNRPEAIPTEIKELFFEI